MAALVVALLCPALPATAQGRTTGSVKGTIKDVNGGVLPAVVVTALNIASGRQVETTTDGMGTYGFDGLTAGTYRITARLSGFSESGRSVAVAAGETVTTVLVLSLGGLSEEITVTAAKGERATAEINQIVTIVSARDIEQRRPQGVNEAFERAPNVRIMDTNPYRARPQFRGFANSRILLVVDGERLNNGRYDVNQSGSPPSTIDVSQILSYDVVGGAASSLYGSDAVAGTINIITKTADRPMSGKTFDLTSSIDFNGNSSFTRGNLAATFAAPKVAFRAAVSGGTWAFSGGGRRKLTRLHSSRLPGAGSPRSTASW
jgi:outer membrane receptor protein involved in Fe transport